MTVSTEPDIVEFPSLGISIPNAVLRTGITHWFLRFIGCGQRGICCRKETT